MNRCCRSTKYSGSCASTLPALPCFFNAARSGATFGDRICRLQNLIELISPLKKQAIPVSRIGESQSQLHLPIHSAKTGVTNRCSAIAVGADLTQPAPLVLTCLIDIEATEGWLQQISRRLFSATNLQPGWSILVDIGSFSLL